MERRRHILYAALMLIIALAVFDIIGIKLYFFWIYWWYDVVMHFTAGIIGGLATYWVLFESGHFFRSARREGLAIAVIFICVMIVGVAWEIFEYKFGLVGVAQEGYKLDTMNDLILDGAGALFAALLTIKKRNG